MPSEHSRLRRESRTVEAMVRLYCRGHHDALEQLCAECDELLAYARKRVEKCPFHDGKATCAKCPVHCYTAKMREKIRTVMRYAGPRMLYRHPVLALFHFIDGLKAAPTPKGKGADPQRHRRTGW